MGGRTEECDFGLACDTATLECVGEDECTTSGDCALTGRCSCDSGTGSRGSCVNPLAAAADACSVEFESLAACSGEASCGLSQMLLAGTTTLLQPESCLDANCYREWAHYACCADEAVGGGLPVSSEVDCKDVQGGSGLSGTTVAAIVIGSLGLLLLIVAVVAYAVWKVRERKSDPVNMTDLSTMTRSTVTESYFGKPIKRDTYVTAD